MGVEPVTLQQFPSRALEAYTELELARLDRKRSIFQSLPYEDQQLLPEYESRITSMTACVNANAKLLAKMADSVGGITSSTTTPATTPTASSASSSKYAPPSGQQQQEQQQKGPIPPPLLGVDEIENGLASDGHLLQVQEDPKLQLSRRVKKGLSNLAMEWSEVGKVERERMYNPIIESVEEAYEESKKAMRSLKRENFKILIPGAGNGRLAWELVCKGYYIEGCEESFIELLIGNFIINNTNEDTKFVFYPYVHEYSNNKSKNNLIQSIEIPDINPKNIPNNAADFTMRAANFIHAYDGQDNIWDIIISFKAFDINEVALDHTRRVAQILKPGGVWIVVGPTPCVEGAQGDGVHISAEEFIELIRRCGFKIIKNESMTSLYSTDQNSLRTVYTQCPFIVAVKVRPLA